LVAVRSEETGRLLIELRRVGATKHQFGELERDRLVWLAGEGLVELPGFLGGCVTRRVYRDGLATGSCGFHDGQCKREIVSLSCDDNAGRRRAGRKAFLLSCGHRAQTRVFRLIGSASEDGGVVTGLLAVEYTITSSLY
jgi:hypothetical protein